MLKHIEAWGVQEGSMFGEFRNVRASQPVAVALVAQNSAIPGGGEGFPRPKPLRNIAQEVR